MLDLDELLDLGGHGTGPVRNWVREECDRIGREFREKEKERLNRTYCFTEERMGIPAGKHQISVCDDYMLFVELGGEGVCILDRKSFTQGLADGWIRGGAGSEDPFFRAKEK